jgi:hypothetical protein
MSVITLVATLIAVAAGIAFIVVRGGTPTPTVQSMLRRDDKPGEGR